tara:strand:+ start:208 stop:762 length:555 start_codon:yes stop_codon:yes gene_type:complete
MKPVTLKTDRLVLRPWRNDDFEAFAAMSADPQVMRYLIPLNSRAESDAVATTLKAYIETNGFGFWAMEIPGIAPFIGFTGLLRVGSAMPFAPAVEVGWRLARPHWGKGYASEAARAALAFGFDTLELDEIVSMTVPANKRSQSVMQRIGMTRDETGDFKHSKLPDGDPLQNHFLYRKARKAIRP